MRENPLTHFALALVVAQTVLAALLAVACGSSDSSSGLPGITGGGETSSSGRAGTTSSAGAGAGASTSGGSSGATGVGGSGSSAAGASASNGGASAMGGMGNTAGSAGKAGNTGAGGSSGSAGNAGAAGATGSAGSSGTTTGCGAGDTNLPAEPTIPPACKTLEATHNVTGNGSPSETALDTATIQSALSSCTAGQAVKLTASASNNAFITGPLNIPSGISLWVDAGATLYGTRSTSVYNGAGALISVKGTGSGIYGAGIIDGQGGEPIIGGSGSFWDQNGNGGSSPALISVQGATNFTMYGITLHNAPMFHVKLGAKGFVVWGITIKTPSKSTNSAGTALTISSAHNTDGVDPGEAASNGYIVCNKISDGDDHIAIKGSSPTGVTNLTIAHNHFEAGHGMSIGSEFTGGVSGINVYDLSIDGSLGGNANGIRIKSDSSRGGLVNNVTYSDVCVRDLATPILLTPKYTTDTGSDIPQYTNIKIQNFHALTGPSNQTVTLDGYDSSHLNSITLDNVVVDGIVAARVLASYTTVTLGPGAVNFTPSGTGVTVKNDVTGTSTPNPCTNKWVTF
jgi:polygalacturonase